MARGKKTRKPAKRRRANVETRTPGTPETVRKLRKPSYQRWQDAKIVTGTMDSAAKEIEAVYEYLTLGVRVKSPVVERVSPGVDHDDRAYLMDAYRHRYKPWADELSARHKRGCPPALEIVLDLLVDGANYNYQASAIDNARRWRRGTTKAIVLRSLLEYAVMAGWSRAKELSDFDAAHGGNLRKAA